MQSVLIVVHLMIVVVLVAVVLLQRSEGGALGVGGGGGFLTGRGQANALTRATAILAALFFATSMGLTILARFSRGPEITFQSLTPIEPPGGGKAKEGEGKASLLEQLRRMEDQSSKSPALPPGVSLPAQTAPAAPEGTQSVVETAPAAPQGVKLPPLKQPATPLSSLTPPQPGPGTGGEAPAAQSPMLKTEPPSPPWQK
jgi:preprotein translocase subunit SecG